MAAKKQKIQKKKHKGGATPEDSRNTVAVKLRLQPEDAEWLRARASAEGCNVSEFIGRLRAQVGGPAPAVA